MSDTTDKFRIVEFVGKLFIGLFIGYSLYSINTKLDLNLNYSNSKLKSIDFNLEHLLEETSIKR